MASVIEHKLNRTAVAPTITVGTDYAAVMIHSQPANPVYLDGVAWGLITIAADQALAVFNTLHIFKVGDITGVNLNLASILALPGIEEIYRSSVKNGVGSEDFDHPIQLDAGYNYLAIAGDLVLTGALTGAASLYLTVRG